MTGAELVASSDRIGPTVTAVVDGERVACAAWMGGKDPLHYLIPNYWLVMPDPWAARVAGASRQPIRVTDLADAVAVLELIGGLYLAAIAHRDSNTTNTAATTR